MKDFTASPRQERLLLCASVKPFALPEAWCSEAIRELDTSDWAKDPGSSRSDHTVVSFDRGRRRKFEVSPVKPLARNLQGPRLTWFGAPS